MDNCDVILSTFIVVPIFKHLEQIAMWNLLLLAEKVSTDIVFLSSLHRNGEAVF